ncbi:MAG TPA: class I SAM-dependent methyltransferase, partial [Chitinispirillaceae bacterium]|nr:class I SAM-dependent methyltransferase [Chitinispirillaceae bacterium]
MKCRHCQNELTLPFLDLGSSPPSNAYLTQAALQYPEKWFPLRVLVCENCWLVQTEDFAQADELFSPDYAYFSATSSSWLAHAESYVTQMVKRFTLNNRSHVVEVAANDGYLLQYVKGRGIPCTGIEPTASTAAAARAKGIEIIESFFGKTLADELSKLGKTADLMVATNVLAHVPDINDFGSGFTRLLKAQGVVTFEFPHLLNLVKLCQFDTIYHEHYSYLSLTAVIKILHSNGLKVFDVEELPTHGGSLRVFAHRMDVPEDKFDYSMYYRVNEILKKESDAGVNTAAFYRGFQSRVEFVKNNFLEFLLGAKKQGKKVAAYGAAAKGNTLLNFAGIRPDLISFVVDRSISKQ